MATQVAPEQEAMAGLKAQPKVPGNGCCMCCGGAPPDIDVRKITALGGKYAQAGKRNQKDDSPSTEFWEVIVYNVVRQVPQQIIRLSIYMIISVVIMLYNVICIYIFFFLFILNILFHVWAIY